MNELLNSVKADLLDRRLRPALALLGVALLAAVAYAAFGGGSGSSTPGASSAPAATASAASGISVSAANSQTQEPVAETTSGAGQQTGGATRNPFSAVPGAKTASAAAASASAGSEASSKTGASSGSEAQAGSKSSTGESPSSSGGATPSPAKKSPAAKAKTVYTVAVLFGAAPAGSPSPSPSLTPYEHLKRQQPLPSASQPLVVFRGVTAGGGSASFTLVGEAILRGSAACLPSASQCQAIDLKPGQVEELEYVPPEGTPVVYQLQVVSIDASKASAATARRIFRAESEAGLRFLRSAGLSALPGLRYSAENGVLVFPEHPPFAGRALIGRAHVAAWASSLRG